ncbi:MAG: Ig-like domain-containing protein [Clostridia bacterium]|nr:Ig-like domain-containing protein [Clostridia bacterium]
MKSISIKMIKIIILLVVGVCLFSIASKVSAFTINPSNPTVTEGEVLKFKVLDDEGKDISRKIRWRSEKTSIATVGYSSGELTAKKAGTVTITSEHYDTKEVVEFTVTVIEDNRITLNETSITMNIDEKMELIVLNSKGKEISDNDIEWTSSNEKIVKVKKGEILPEKAGNVTITARNKKTGATATCDVVVNEPEKEESEKKTSSTSSAPATPAKPATPATPAKPTTSTKPETSTTVTQTPTATIIDPEESIISTDTAEGEGESENEKEIEKVTNAATNGGFSINGLLSKITEIINKIINSIFNFINVGLNR